MLKLSLYSCLIALCSLVSAQTYTLIEGAEYSLTDWTNASGSIVVPSSFNDLPITSIGDNAFAWNTQITSVTLPSTIREIGDLAFRECTSLVSINFPEGLTKIGNTAFGACRSLNPIILPSSLEIIELYAFSRCSSLESITIPANVTTMGRSIFFDCGSLKDVFFRNDLNNLPEYTFENSNSLQNIFFTYSIDIDLNSNAFLDVIQSPLILYLLENFYESNDGVSVPIDPTPTGDFTSTYTYQWYFNGFAIPDMFGGNSPAYTIDGASTSDGTWRVDVTNDTGTTSSTFEYRVFSDADSDSLSDYRETAILGTNPNLEDTDEDGLSDSEEVNTYSTDPNDTDSDDDLLSDYDEVITHSTNPLNDDSDDDGLLDGEEVDTYATDPNDTDSDDDLLSDYDEVITHSTNPNDTDSDDDLLSDYDEVITHSTNPNLEDSTGDGFNDGFLVTQGKDPLVDYSDIRSETVRQMPNLRLRSSILQVANNESTVQVQVDESSDLEPWTETGDAATIIVPANTGTKFFRFKIAE